MNGGYIQNVTTNSIESDTDNCYNVFYVGSNVEFNNYKIKIKLEEGTNATGCSSYNCGSVTFKVTNKNLFNDNLPVTFGNGSNHTVKNKDGSFTCTANLSSARNTGTQLLLDKNKDYAVQIKVDSITTDSERKMGAVEILGYNNNKLTVIKSASIEVGEKDFTFNSGGYETWSIHVSGWYGSGKSGTIVYRDIQVEEGEKTDYKKYEEQSNTFPMKEGQVLHKGDYLSDDGTHKRKGKRTLDGTENGWTYFEANSQWARPYIIISDKKIGEDDSTENVISNKFKSTTWENRSKSSYGVFTYSGDRRVSFLIPKSELSSLDKAGVQEYFKNNNTEIEYNLDTEIDELSEAIEPFSEEQQEAHDKIKTTVHTYKGTTHIYCSDEVSCEFEEEHLVDLESYINSKLGVQASEPQHETPSMEQPQIEETEMIGGVE